MSKWILYYPCYNFSSDGFSYNTSNIASKQINYGLGIGMSKSYRIYYKAVSKSGDPYTSFYQGLVHTKSQATRFQFEHTNIMNIGGNSPVIHLAGLCKIGTTTDSSPLIAYNYGRTLSNSCCAYFHNVGNDIYLWLNGNYSGAILSGISSQIVGHIVAVFLIITVSATNFYLIDCDSTWNSSSKLFSKSWHLQKTGKPNMFDISLGAQRCTLLNGDGLTSNGNLFCVGVDFTKLSGNPLLTSSTCHQYAKWMYDKCYSYPRQPK